MRKSYLCLFLVASLMGCQSVAKQNATVDSWQGGPVYVTASEIDQTKAYRIYSSQQKSEIAKIRYLVNLIRYSERKFIRNDMVLPGSYAAKGLDFKMRKYSDELFSADHFAEELGTYSRKTGKEYFVVLPDGSIAQMKLALRNELDRLEAYESSNNG